MPLVHIYLVFFGLSNFIVWFIRLKSPSFSIIMSNLLQKSSGLNRVVSFKKPIRRLCSAFLGTDAMSYVISTEGISPITTTASYSKSSTDLALLAE